jgi:lysophospholipase L1-like esterase
MRTPGSHRIGFNVLQVVLLTVALGVSWAYRNNTLFGARRWLVGKDLGKFVFYTYDFMFRPLAKAGVNLASDMGFQEILYARPENELRALAEMKCEALVGNDGYLWILLGKNGLECSGFRVSRNEHFPNGYFRYDREGRLVEQAPMTDPLIQLPSWFALNLTRSNTTWRLAINDHPLMTVDDPQGTAGHFGFKGSGNTRSPVMIKDIRMTFRDPSRPSRTWTERERFKPAWERRATWLGAFLIAAGLIGLHRLRQQVLAGYVPGPDRETWLVRSDTLLLLSLAAAAGAVRWTGAAIIPGVIVACELAHAVCLFRLTRGGAAPAAYARWRSGLVYTAALSLLAAASFSHLGEWLGRVPHQTRSSLGRVDPEAYLIRPDRSARSNSASYVLREPAHLRPGQPLFTDGYAFREQTITADFLIRAHCTLDVVFQQQSYVTRGDPDGEWLPLQRRMLRLTTRPDVPWGVSTRPGNRPAPFRTLEGDVRTDQTNRLVITSAGRGLRVELNGAVTEYRDILPLGWGETGFMVFEDDVTLLAARVDPLASSWMGGRTRVLYGLALPWLIGAAGWLLLRASGPIAFSTATSLVLSAAWPLALYLLAGLVCGPDHFAFLEEDRRVWLDLLLGASMVSLLNVLVLRRGRLRGVPIYFNLVTLAAIAAAALYIWDAWLPKSHILKLKFTDDAIAPGELIHSNRGDTGPWYANNRAIGASTYVWRQRFSHETIIPDKPAGVLRVFVVGGSQAWGSGAADSRSTFAELLEQRLRSKGLPVEIFNAGINGAGLSKVNDLHRDLLTYFDPDLIIADFGLNDSAGLRMVRDEARREVHMAELLREFEELVERCQARGTDLVVAQEAMCRETPLRPNRPYYDRIQQIARDRSVVIVDPGPAIREQESWHFVWWDTAHFAPYGHRLLAELLEPTVESVLRARLARSQTPAASP